MRYIRENVKECIEAYPLKHLDIATLAAITQQKREREREETERTTETHVYGKCREEHPLFVMSSHKLTWGSEDGRACQC